MSWSRQNNDIHPVVINSEVLLQHIRHQSHKLIVWEILQELESKKKHVPPPSNVLLGMTDNDYTPECNN